MVEPHPRAIELDRDRDRKEQLAEAARTNSCLGELLKQMEMVMATLDDVLMKVYEQRGQIDSLHALTSGIKVKLQEALSSAGALSPAQQAKVDEVFTELHNNTAAIVKSINANDDDPSNDDLAPQTPPVDASSGSPPVDASTDVGNDPRIPPLTP